jgi:ectoine hydroxylase-related dioxygenase (phytanoyl-CoA dioxygenase family)
VGVTEGDHFEALGLEEGAENFIQFFNPHYYNVELSRSAFVQKAKLMAQQILGPKARLCFTLLIVKPPKVGSTTPWHQDEAFSDPSYDYHTVSFWLPLQPVDQQNGCMEFIAGSHHHDVLPHAVPQGVKKLHVIECVEGFFPSHAIPCPLPVGGVTIHDSRTLHYTGANMSDQPRIAFVAKFDITPTPRQTPRHFPWRAEQRSVRAERRRAWLLQGGILRELQRIISKVDPTDPSRMLFYAKRALTQAARAMRV